MRCLFSETLNHVLISSLSGTYLPFNLGYTCYILSWSTAWPVSEPISFQVLLSYWRCIITSPCCCRLRSYSTAKMYLMTIKISFYNFALILVSQKMKDVCLIVSSPFDTVGNPSLSYILWTIYTRLLNITTSTYCIHPSSSWYSAHFVNYLTYSWSTYINKPYRLVYIKERNKIFTYCLIHW